MKTHILLATHGRFAEGIKSSIELIMGKVENLETMNCYCDNEVKTSEIIQKTVSEFNYDTAKLLVVTDLFGGSVNNEFIKYIDDYPFILVTGLSLPLLLQLIMHSEKLDEETINEIIENAKNFTLCCNFIKPSYEDNDL